MSPFRYRGYRIEPSVPPEFIIYDGEEEIDRAVTLEDAEAVIDFWKIAP